MGFQEGLKGDKSMSQQYGQPGGLQGQPPNYNPAPGQPYNQPQPPPQPPYGAPPPNYQGPNPPNYGGPPNYQQSDPTQRAYPVPPAAVQAPARQVPADGYERTLSLLAYIWVAACAAGVLGVGETPVALRSASGGLTYSVGFSLNLGFLVCLALPLAVIYAVRQGELVRFHARQALYLGIAYIVVRLVIELLYLIPSTGVQDILFSGVIVGLLHVALVFIALFAGVKAFYNRELYALPVIGGFIK
jgi:uncharacterized membrane protein